MKAAQFWIVAGPNGAGKTTCVQKEPISGLLPEVCFFNPDDRTLLKLRSMDFEGFGDAPMEVQTRLFIESADEVFAELTKAISEGQSVGVETVLSSDKYAALVEWVVGNQGFVGLIYVALATPSIAKQRVAARVARGGHSIPENKIEQRWHRSLEFLRSFAEAVTAFWVIDNSDSNPSTIPTLLASGKFGQLEYLNDASFLEMKSALATLPRT